MSSLPAAPEDPPAPSGHRPEAVAPQEPPSSGPTRSVLPRIEKQLGAPVRVELRGGEGDGAKEAAEGPLLEGKYRLRGELGRGGVGVVHRGSDIDLGRDVAIKVLREEHHDRPDVVKRFVEEAQIGGQLQHPGVVPVYDLGMVGERPFFAMKLIRGSSLESLLAGRKTPRDERRRFLGIFEQICQTLAYAHERGVIHRDLKPGNVMVGAFGEVQVVDWGMGKVMGKSESVAPARRVEPRVETARSTSTDVLSELGSMMGTPGYMPPEQVKGEIDAIDERSDVFSLGAILFEILTGDPPQVGTPMERLRMAIDPATWRIGERLAAAGADAELVDLATRCLASERLVRPRSAKDVAQRAAAYLSAVEERAQRAQVEAAEAQAQAAREEARAERERAQAEQAELRAQAERRKRFAALTVGGALVLAVVGTAWGLVQTGRARETNLQRRLEDEQRSRIESARLGRNAEAVNALLAETEQALRASDAARATIALDAARRRADEGGAEKDAVRLGRLSADLDLLTVLDRTDQLRWSWVEKALVEPAVVATKLREGLRRFGADPETVSVGEAAARVDASAIRERIVSAMDLLVRDGNAGDVRAVLRRVDADPFRDGLRDAVLAADRTRIVELGESAAALAQSPGFAAFLGEVNEIDVRRRLEVLEGAAIRRPTDVRLLMLLFYCYAEDGKDTSEPRLRWAQAAVTAAPGNAGAWSNLAAALGMGKRWEEAIAVARKAVELDPTVAWAHTNLGAALVKAGRRDEAMASYRKAVEVDPTFPRALKDLAANLNSDGKPEEALGYARKAVELYPRWSSGHFVLANALAGLKRPDEAIDSYRTAIALDPNSAEAHHNLGVAFFLGGRVDEAIESCQRAAELRPDLAQFRLELALALQRRERHEEALASFRKAVDLGSTTGAAHYGVGWYMTKTQRWDEAITAYRRAIELAPAHAEAHCNLATCLQNLGRLPEALAAYRRGHELGSKRADWRYPSAAWVKTAESRVALEAKLPALLARSVEPHDNAERLDLTILCYLKKLYRASARFSAEAFAAEPASADGHRYNAACSAALAAAGRGEDAAGLDDGERARLRKQALGWLRADLDLHARKAETDDRAATAQELRRWQEDADLAGLRDTADLVSFPAEERNHLLQFWADVAAVRKTADTPSARGPR